MTMTATPTRRLIGRTSTPCCKCNECGFLTHPHMSSFTRHRPDCPELARLDAEHAARKANTDQRPIHLQVTASDVKCGAPMRIGSLNPDGWDMGTADPDGHLVTCPDCLGR